MQHLVKQGLLAAIGKCGAFMDLDIQGCGENTVHGIDQQGHDLAGMSHDPCRFTAIVRFLMQRFDAWHLATLLGNFLNW